MTREFSMEELQVKEMKWHLRKGVCHPHHWAYMRLCAAAGVEPMEPPPARTFNPIQWNNKVKQEITSNPKLKAKAQEMDESFWNTLQKLQREQSATERPCVCGAAKFLQIQLSTHQMRSIGVNELNLPSGMVRRDLMHFLSGLWDDEQMTVKMCMACARVQNVDLDLLRRQVDVAEAVAFLECFMGRLNLPFEKRATNCVQVAERRYLWPTYRTRAAAICIALQSLELPALVLHHVVRADNNSLEADDEYFRVSQLCETVRHFHQRKTR